LLWTFVFSLSLSLLFSMRLGAQFGWVLGQSLAAQRLTSAFDLGAALGVLLRIGDGAPPAGLANLSGVALFGLIYFLLVPGTLFCYQAAAPAKLSTLLGQGLLHFWRMVRITLLTAVVSALILGPLLALSNRWSDHVGLTTTGYAAWALESPLVLLILLAAALLRLYFDLVQAYTVQLGLQLRPNGKPDRRVRRALVPALRAIKQNFLRAYGSFVLLTLLGLLALFVSWRAGLHTLAQPRVWPLFLLAQTGLFLNLFTRFWQRGAETIVILDNPILPPRPPAPQQDVPVVVEDPLTEPLPREEFYQPTPSVPAESVTDPIPNPEPASPSLPEPDRGIYHKE
jgi:hypothetical protein